MAALSLGVDELERRLELVRQRLNSYSLQDALYRCGAVVLGGAASVLSLDWLTDGSASGPLRWGFLALSIAAAAFFAVRVRNRWLSLEAVAELADREAKLDCRLSTMLAQRNTPTRSRLRSLLLAEVFLLASRWTPARLAPRRVPRSIAVFVAALALFGLANLLSPPQPERDSAAATAAGEQVAALSQGAAGSPSDRGGLAPSSVGAAANEENGRRHEGAAAGAPSGSSESPGDGEPEAAGRGGTSNTEAAPAGGGRQRAPRSNGQKSATQDDSANRAEPDSEQSRRADPSAGTDPRKGESQRDAARENGNSRTTPAPARRGTEQEAGAGPPAKQNRQTPGPRESDTDRQRADTQGRPDGKGGEAHDGRSGSEAEKNGLFGAAGKRDATTSDAAAMLIKLTAFSSVTPDQFEKQGDNVATTSADSSPDEDQAPLAEQSDQEIPLVRAPLAAEHEAMLRDIFTPRQ